jgi:hypothetical protein
MAGYVGPCRVALDWNRAALQVFLSTESLHMPTTSAHLKRRDLLRAATYATVAPAHALLARDTVQALSAEALKVRDFGARFDGQSDDTVSLQRAIDAAAQQRRSLLLPSGTSLLSAPLDLRGRYIALLGDPVGRSILKANGPLICLLNAQETQDVIDSPLYLYGLTLDGAGITKAGLGLRYRHRTVFDTLAVERCDIGVEEIDSWLGRRMNCRTRGTDVGWRLRGANHSSIWQGCSFTASRDAHIEIGADGTAKDGNNALLFQGCDIEFGDGHGVVVLPGATATFETCYLGEAIGGDVLRNSGTVSIRGGTLFVGHSAEKFGIVPLGGTVSVTDSALRGQQFGTLDRLVGVPASAQQSAGKVTFRDVDTQIKLGGDPIFQGDVLGTMPIRVFAPVLGRNWQATASNVAIADKSVGDTRTVRCTAVTGPNPLVGLAAQLTNTNEARRHGAAYVVILYTSSQPVQLRFTNGTISRSPWRFIGTLPATSEVGTYVKVDVPVEFASFSTVELLMQAAPGDQLALHHATISDAGMINPGPLANLAKAR